MIPEETKPPPELQALERYWVALRAATSGLPEAERDGFVRVAVDPYVNAWHRALLGAPRRLKASIRAERAQLLHRALREGPQALGLRQRRMLLYDPDCVDALHRRVWGLSEDAAARWGRPGALAAAESSVVECVGQRPSA